MPYVGMKRYDAFGKSNFCFHVSKTKDYFFFFRPSTTSCFWVLIIIGTFLFRNIAILVIYNSILCGLLGKKMATKRRIQGYKFKAMQSS